MDFLGPQAAESQQQVFGTNQLPKRRSILTLLCYDRVNLCKCQRHKWAQQRLQERTATFLDVTVREYTPTERWEPVYQHEAKLTSKPPHGWLGSDATTMRHDVLVEHVLQLHARMHPFQRRCLATSAHSAAINASQTNQCHQGKQPWH